MEQNLPELPEYLKGPLQRGELIDTILLDREGNWFHNGEPIRHERIVALFNRSVSRTAEGTYVIHYGEHVYPIDVEDAPVFVTGVRFEGFAAFERVFINLSTGEEEELDIQTLIYRKNNALYCRVRQGSLTAKFRRSPSFHILERLDESGGRYYLTLCGKRIYLKKEE
ncbi:MAG: DUF1285 domain-containing protein [Spirochaetes bacterium]|nr:DUF1285 domain-containing protein [Spirochaetota bacterium]